MSKQWLTTHTLIHHLPVWTPSTNHVTTTTTRNVLDSRTPTTSTASTVVITRIRTSMVDTEPGRNGRNAPLPAMKVSSPASVHARNLYPKGKVRTAVQKDQQRRRK